MNTSKEEIIIKVNEISEEYHTKLTLRQIYYRLVSKQIIENTINNYKRLSKILVDARMNESVPFDIFEDRSREVIIGDRPRWENDPVEERFDFAKEMYEQAEDDFKTCQYSHKRWHLQPKRVVVMLEKEALARLFQEETFRLDVDLLPCKGYPSLTILKEFADKMSERGVNLDGNLKTVKILYFGDFDPTGMDIERYITERLEDLGLTDLEVERIALDGDQVTEMNLPPAPAKKTDSRANEFIAKHGDRAVELDAVEPRELKSMVYDAIQNEFDLEASRKSKEIQKKKQKELEEMIEEYFENLEED